MNPPWRMFSPRNSVRVVLLIAQGWRGTSLPWVSIRKEIQRHRCWAFLRKHGYSEGIHGGLIKKAQHRWRCPPRYVLTQGSLHYRLATLGYQKRNPYGVRLSSWKRSLWVPLPFEKMKFKKAQHLRRCVPLNVLTQGSSLRSPTLGYQKQNPYGVR